MLSKVDPACGRISDGSLRRRTTLSHFTRRSKCPQWARSTGNGLLKLVKQPVRSCSRHLIVYRFFNVDTETTARSSELPHPRRNQVTPRERIVQRQDDAYFNVLTWQDILNRRDSIFETRRNNEGIGMVALHERGANAGGSKGQIRKAGLWFACVVRLPRC